MDNDTMKITAVAPDWEGMVSNLRRQGTPSRVFYFEHGIADNVMDELDRCLGISRNLDISTPTFAWDRSAAIHQFLGHELFRVYPKRAKLEIPTREGAWVEESSGPVGSWKDFEQFPWPELKDADFSVLDHYERTLPGNMRVFNLQKVWEDVKDLLGFEHFCFALYEDPALVDAVFERVGNYVLSMVRTLCQYSCIGAVYIADDLGFKSSTFLAPEELRRLVVPWHRRLATLAHQHGKFFFLHSCGQMYSLMDDYIDDVKIDGKHSFEDVILPVTGAKAQYGDRLTLLGGMDVDLLARSGEADIRRRTREILNVCLPGGGYFLGLGNWVTEYIPTRNYLVMLDEARRM